MKLDGIYRLKKELFDFVQIFESKLQNQFNSYVGYQDSAILIILLQIPYCF